MPLVSISKKRPVSSIFWRFLPFWIFLVFFKFGAGIHFSVLSPLGEQLLPLWAVGCLIGGGSLVQLLLDVPAGYLLDRFGYLKLLKVTTFIFLFAAVCLMFGLTRTTYVLSLIMSTFGWLFFNPGINAYVLSHAPKQHAGKFISLRDVFASCGIVLSSAVLPFVLFLAPQQIGFIIFALLSVTLLTLFFSPKDHVSVHNEVKLPTQHYYVRRHYILTLLKTINKLNPASTMLLLLNLAASTFYGIIWFVVPLVIAHQAESGLLGIGLGIFDFSVLALGFMLGNLADKVNKRTLIFFGLLIFAVSGALLGCNFGWLFIIFGFLATTGDEMAGLSLWSWLHSLDKDHAQDGTVAGVINLFDDLGWAVGPIAAGILYAWLGPTWTIVLGALPIFVVWLIYQVFVIRNKRNNPMTLFVMPAKPHRFRHKS
jgi:MFS family permease